MIITSRNLKLLLTSAVLMFPIVVLYLTWQEIQIAGSSFGVKDYKVSSNYSNVVRPSAGNITSTKLSKTSTKTSTTQTPAVSIFVRMSGKLQDHRARFFCELFRTMVLFWPPSYGKIVLVLDNESKEDHDFGNAMIKQTKKKFPDYQLKVDYEALPRDPRVLSFPGMKRNPGYNRQLWSSFFIDLYTDDSVIAWMDTDAAFVMPLTQASIFNGKKVRLIGSECPLARFGWVKEWARGTERALGLPFFMDFMIYFPVYIFRDTITKTREHILKRFKTTNFEEAFRSFFKAEFMSPVDVILSYAWYFERDRYEWNIKLCTKLDEYNKKFPEGHKIPADFVTDVLPEPQTADHTKYTEPGRPPAYHNVLVNYCLTLNAAGNRNDSMCRNKNFSAEENLMLFHHDVQRIVSPQDTPCVGDKKEVCLQTLRRRYKEVGGQVERNERRFDWQDMDTASRMANETYGIKCFEIV